MLSRTEAFRLGFLLRCAETGLTPDQIRGLTKQAMFGLSEFKALLSGLTGAATAGLKAPLYAGTALLAGGLGAGALAGGLTAKLTDAETDPEDVKRQELVAAYKHHADLARRRAAQLAYRPTASAGRRSTRGELLGR